MNALYGKYRGVVTDVHDPMMMGRIRAKVPDVTGDKEIGWAMPCLPFAGADMGFFGLPTVGSGVWIEFEQGDPDYPIWSGCWWGSPAEVPKTLLAPPYMKVVLLTADGNKLILDDTPGIGGISMETAAGQKITIKATGIEIDNGMGASIKLQGPLVSINGNALEVL